MDDATRLRAAGVLGGAAPQIAATLPSPDPKASVDYPQMRVFALCQDDRSC